MQQLRPRVVFLVACFGSLFLCLAVLAVAILVFDDGADISQLVLAFLGVAGAWSIFGIPISAGLCYIRHRIGQKSSVEERVRSAVISCLAFFAIGFVSGLTGYAIAMEAGRSVVTGVLLLVFVNSLALSVFSGINAIVRSSSVKRQTTLPEASG